MAPHQWIFFSGGILVMLSGLYLLTPEKFLGLTLSGDPKPIKISLNKSS